MPESELEEKVKTAFEKARKKFLFRDVELKQAIQLSDMTILSCTGKIGGLIGKKGIVVGELSKDLNSKVRVVEHSKDEKKVISDLIGNARLLGVNKIYTPEGQTLKVMINAKDQRLIPNPQEIEKAMQELLQSKARIEFT